MYSRTSKKGPSEKGTNSLQGILSILCIFNTFQLPKRGQPLYKEQNGWSQSVLYLEVPLYSTNKQNIIHREDNNITTTRSPHY